MAVVVDPQNPLREIDEATAEQILQGKITSWKSLGQDDRPIQLVKDAGAEPRGVSGVGDVDV